MKSFNFFGSYSSYNCGINPITYLDNSGITDPDIRANVIELVAELAREQVCHLIDVLYPDIGENAAQNKLNLINPLDTDAAFRRTFHGGVTFDPVTGTKGNGINGYYSSKYNPISEYGFALGLGITLCINDLSSGPVVDIGVIGNSSSIQLNALNPTSNSTFRYLDSASGSFYSISNPTPSTDGVYSMFQQPLDTTC